MGGFGGHCRQSVVQTAPEGTDESVKPTSQIESHLHLYAETCCLEDDEYSAATAVMSRSTLDNRAEVLVSDPVQTEAHPPRTEECPPHEGEAVVDQGSDDADRPRGRETTVSGIEDHLNFQW